MNFSSYYFYNYSANPKIPLIVESLFLLLMDKSAGSGFGRSKSASRVPARTARKHWAGERRIIRI
jgi:hypothetical protein